MESTDAWRESSPPSPLAAPRNDVSVIDGNRSSGFNEARLNEASSGAEKLRRCADPSLSARRWLPRRERVASASALSRTGTFASGSKLKCASVRTRLCVRRPAGLMGERKLYARAICFASPGVMAPLCLRSTSSTVSRRHSALSAASESGSEPSPAECAEERRRVNSVRKRLGPSSVSSSEPLRYVDGEGIGIDGMRRCKGNERTGVMRTGVMCVGIGGSGASRVRLSIEGHARISPVGRPLGVSTSSVAAAPSTGATSLPGAGVDATVDS